MTDSAAYLDKSMSSVFDSGSHLRIVDDHLAWNRQRGLEDSRSCDIGPREFVDESVTVSVNPQSEPLFGLDAMMMVKRVVGELTE